MRCKNCNKKVHRNILYCPYCGERVNAKKKSRLEEFEAKYINVPHKEDIVRSRGVSAVFALLGGTFGLQHFYNGHYALGFTCVLFSWTGIPTILGIINAIQYLTCSSDRRFTEEYCIIYK